MNFAACRYFFVVLAALLIGFASCKDDVPANDPNQSVVLTGPTVFVQAGLLRLPQGIAVDASGNVWVADTRNNRIRKFSTAGTQTDSINVTSPSAIAFDKNTGDLFIVENSSTVLRYIVQTRTWIAAFPFIPFTGNSTSVFDVGNRGTVSINVAVLELGDIDTSPSGDIYVSGRGSPANFVARILHGNISIVAASFLDSSIARPLMLAADGFGTVFTAFRFSRGPTSQTELYACIPSNIQQSHVMAEPFISGAAQGATVDAAGYLYIADAGTQELVVVSTASERTVARHLIPDVGGFSMTPQDISVASDGSVYVVVTDRLGTEAGAVLKYTRSTR
ncbi:MAG: SMP-30/gluconolactonase/LRE family protein [Bacteroidetes bacterium]|nr:SMP-30/gluconolactonase/LRE family protein [Bacteroidota bacterium]MCW5895927.1 SMP-30/gluconolactonase/LRE family protein [Bacteroidota bacterium]